MTWYNVNKIVQVWSGHADSAQKKGKLYPPVGLEDIDKYKESIQFDPEKLQFDLDGRFDREGTERHDLNYAGFWVRREDLSFEQYNPDAGDPDPVGPDPSVPEPEEPPVVAPPPSDVPSFEEIGRVVVYLKSL